jgi:glutamate synthase domain-containing protein 1
MFGSGDRLVARVGVERSRLVCGVIGLLVKDPDLEANLGRMVVPMITALAERGPDSSGIAVYSRPIEGDRSGSDEPTLRVSLGSDAEVEWVDLAQWASARYDGSVARIFASGVRIDLPESTGNELVKSIGEAWPTVHVLGTGRMLSVVKDTGWPVETCRRHQLEAWTGHLAVAHTRMATESAVTPLHSHPFVPGPDLCVVHNGSFSNHSSVRRHLEAEGVRFDSDNDSEVAARLLARRLASGDDLDEATRWVMKEMDGFFTLVVGTATGMSVVRDAFACKPAVVAETSSYVAVASEYRALAELPEIGRARVFEPQPEEVYTWTA